MVCLIAVTLVTDQLAIPAPEFNSGDGDDCLNSYKLIFDMFFIFLFI